MCSRVIEVEQLRFAYPGTPFRLELNHISVSNEENVAVIGPSGCGKSTLLDLIAGIQIPTHGTIRTAGQNLASLTAANRRELRLRKIGFVFQDFRLLEYLSVLDSILLPLKLSGQRIDRTIKKRAYELAERAGINALLDRRPARLSHGERQRAAICRALLGAPELVLADEPTGNLDPATGKAILDLLFEQAREAKAALVMITHEHAILPQFDRVIDIGTENQAVANSVGGDAS